MKHDHRAEKSSPCLGAVDAENESMRGESDEADYTLVDPSSRSEVRHRR